MQSKLTITGRDDVSWEEAKPVVLAAIMKITAVERLPVNETYLKLSINLSFAEAIKTMELALKYFNKEYGGPPINFMIEVNASNERFV